MGINKNFVVRNGLEVATDLIYANDFQNKVGINTAFPEYGLDVQDDIKIEGRIVSSGETGGVVGQYLKSTGQGWEWESFPISRNTVRYTLTAGQLRVPETGTFPDFTLTEQDLTSVYLDGVKLTVGDYSIDVGGGSIALFAAAFGQEEIEVIAHGAAGIGAGTTGILGVTARKAGIDSGSTGQVRIFDFVGLGVTLDGRAGICTVHIDSGGLSDVLSDPSPQLGGNLDLNSSDITGTGDVNITGFVTATGFYGSGSNITGISTLNITGYGVGLGQDDSGQDGLFGEVNDDSAVGIFTDSAAVGLGTTNPRFQTEIGYVGAAGTQLWVNGNARVTGILTVGDSSIIIDGVNDQIRIGAGFTLSADTVAQIANLQLSGIITATGFDGDLTGQHKVFTAGVSNSDDYDIALFLDPTQGGHSFNRFDLGHKLQFNPNNGQFSVAGVTSTRGLQVTGVSTFTSGVTLQGNAQFGDSISAVFGSGNDLHIYSDGSNSYIEDQGNGGINIDANPSITLGQYGTTAEMASFRVGAGVSLFYNNSKKFETTAIGIDVTGKVTADDHIQSVTGNQTATITGSDDIKNDPELILYTNNTSEFRGSRVELLNSSNGTQLSHLNNSIASGSGQYFAIEKTTNDGTFVQQMAIYSYRNDEWVFKTGSNEVESLTINNGQVGIGTTVITDTLTVDGNVRSTNVTVSADITIGGKVQSDVIVGSGYSVGIGSTQPQKALDVSGEILVTGGISTNGTSTAVSLNVVGNDLVITVGSLSTSFSLG